MVRRILERLIITYYLLLLAHFLGKRFEIYKTSLSSKFYGRTFSWTAANIYRNFKAILIALEINSKENSRIFPNPGDFVLPVNKKMTG
jgi:Calcium-activated BK potassium channel alpha subunit